MKWSTDLVMRYSDELSYRRDIKLKNLLGKDSPEGEPYCHNIKIRHQYEFDYTEKEINKLLELKKDPFLIFNLFNISLREYQKEMLLGFISWRFYKLVVSRQIGSSSMINFYVVMQILEGKNITLISPRGGRITSIINILKELPYYIQPCLDVYMGNSMYFRNSTFKVEKTLSKYESNMIYIFEDSAYLSDFDADIMLLQTGDPYQVIVSSVAKENSYFNRFFTRKDMYHSDKFDYKRLDTYMSTQVYQEKIKLLGHKGFAQEYECCMDPDILKKYERSDKISNILNN